MKGNEGKTNFCKDSKNLTYIKRKKYFFLYPEKKFVYFYRKAQYYTKSKNIFKKAYWSLKWLKIRKQGYQLSLDAKIDEGLSLLHHGNRVIVKEVIIGTSCTIGINVIIGYSYNKKSNKYETPKIGNNVYIGHNSSVVGGVTVGNNVLIAPNSYVNKDIPDDSIVIGNNLIIPQKNASEKYLKML